MPNVFQFVDWITMESLRILVNKLTVASYFNTDYNKEFTREFAVGETVRVKLPQRYLIRTGLGYTPQSLNRQFTTVTCDQVFGIDFEWDSVEKALQMERGEEAIRREYLEPAMAQIAQEIDSRAALWAYQNTNNIVGVNGADPTTPTFAYSARQRLIENACPEGEKALIIHPRIPTALTGVGGVQTLFNPQPQISKFYKEASLGRLAGFDTYESMSLYAHTAGTWGGAVTMTAAGQSGSVIDVTCAGAGYTFFKGDVIDITSCFNVNPSTRRSTGVQKQFVITEDLVGVGGGGNLLKIWPPIVGPGDQYQNVDSLPGAVALTLFPGTAAPNGTIGLQGLAIHRDAFALVGVKLETPKAVELASQTRDPETGIAVRFVRQFDATKSLMINRFDVLCGFGNLYSDQASVRVLMDA